MQAKVLYRLRELLRFLLKKIHSKFLDVIKGPFMKEFNYLFSRLLWKDFQPQLFHFEALTLFDLELLKPCL